MSIVGRNGLEKGAEREGEGAERLTRKLRGARVMCPSHALRTHVARVWKASKHTTHATCKPKDAPRTKCTHPTKMQRCSLKTPSAYNMCGQRHACKQNSDKHAVVHTIWIKSAQNTGQDRQNTRKAAFCACCMPFVCMLHGVRGWK